MMTKILFRSLASSSLNPSSKTKSISVRNGDLGSISHFFSTATDTATSEPSTPSSSAKSLRKDSLFLWLVKDTNPKNSTPKEPISQFLKRWIDEGKEADMDNVRYCIRRFRQMKRYNHALEISEWRISSIGNSNLPYGDAAIHLDLICKVRGLEQAEKYFESIPHDSKSFHSYGALLNVYVQKRLLDKAEATMEKIRELGYARNMSYNVMLNLYSQLGEWVKVKSLVQEMENKGINFDKYSYNILLNAYASASDILGMEKLLMKLEADPLLVIDWLAYSITANGYMKADDVAKAEVMLKKSEELIKKGKQKGPQGHEKQAHAYEVLMSQYASIGRKDEVYRIWNVRSKYQKHLNRSYTCIVCSLLKVDDINGAQKMLDKWFTKKVTFDIRFPNFLVSAYCKNGQMEKAESIIRSIIEKGDEPQATTWNHMASGYCKINQMEDAVTMIKKAISKNPKKPDLSVLASCLEYLTEKGDVDEAERIIGLLHEGCKFPAAFRDRISKYIGKENLSKPVQKEQEYDKVEEEILDDPELKFQNAS